MKLQIIIVMIVSLVGAAGAGTLTIETDPPGLDVTVDGKYIGTAPVTVEGPFESENVNVVIIYENERVVTSVDVSDNGNVDVVVIIKEPGPEIAISSSDALPVTIGLFAGILPGVLAAILYFFIAFS